MIDDDVPQEGAKVSLTQSNTKQMQWGINVGWFERGLEPKWNKSVMLPLVQTLWTEKTCKETYTPRNRRQFIEGCGLGPINDDL